MAARDLRRELLLSDPILDGDGIAAAQREKNGKKEGAKFHQWIAVITILPGPPVVVAVAPPPPCPPP